MISIKNILKNLGANSGAVAITILFQLVSVPVFIKFWGVNLYGEWIVLNAFTAYFSMSDIGLSTATANEFSINYVRGKYRLNKILLNNNFFFIVIVYIIILIGLSVLIMSFDLAKLFHFNIINKRTAEIGIFVLTGRVFIGMIGSLLNAIYRAKSKYARGVSIDNVIRVTEMLVLLSSVMSKLPLQYVLIFYFIPRLVGLLFKFFDANKLYNIQIHIRYLSKAEFKKILIPSLSFLSFPIGNSIIIQGFTLLISFVMGSTAVVLFTTMRTLTNFIKSGLGLIGSSVWPEYSLAYGRKDFASMKNVHRYSVGATFYLSILSILFLLVFGKTIYMFWTGYKIEFNTILFVTFLLSLFANGIWFNSSVVLAATNNHKTYSMYYLISTIIAIGIAFFILKIFKNISLLPLALLFVNLFLINVVIKQSLRIVEDSPKEFLKALLIIPFYFIKSKLK